MATLADVLYQTLSILRGERSGAATAAGTATTLIDTVQTEADGYLNGGTLFVFTGAHAGKSRVITTWTLSTKTFTIPTVGAVFAVGDLYAAFDARYPRSAIVQAVNRAISDMGGAQAINEALTTTDNTESYALPSGVSDVRRVQIATSTASPYEWSEPLNNWREYNGRLYFTDYWNIPTGNLLRLTYAAQHTRLTLDADTLPEGYPPERIAAEAAYWAALSKTGYAGSADPETERDMQIANVRRAEARGRFPVRLMKRDPKYTVLP